MIIVQFANQTLPVSFLTEFASKDKHSLVIEGPNGCGKTYLAKMYASLLGFSDVVEVAPKVNDIKDAFEQFQQVDNKVLIVIENLDSGVLSCAYILLKFMEEPSDNLYVVVTCRNKENVPDTILSRSMTVSVGMPTKDDVCNYAKSRYMESYKHLRKRTLWKCVQSFSDVDEVCNYTDEQVQYFSNWSTVSMFTGPVNNLSWKLGHFPDGSEISSNMLIKYIMISNMDNFHVVKCCTDCMNKIDSKRIAKYLVLTKLAFDLKYCE